MEVRVRVSVRRSVRIPNRGCSAPAGQGIYLTIQSVFEFRNHTVYEVNNYD